MATSNTNPNHMNEPRKNANGDFRSEGNMAQIEKHPKVSKTAMSVFRAVKSQVVGSCKVAGVATSLLLASGSVFGLGLGVLDVESNLDQPLNGLITVNVTPGDDLSTLKASVATREEFETLGIDYPEYLKDVNLEVERSGEGAVLRVSSNGVVIKEPFIHFLVKVTWSGGNFLREYTALIDPPVYAAESPKSISKPRTVGTDQSSGDADVSYQPPAIEEPSVVNVDTIDEPYVDDLADTESSQTQNLESSEARYGPVASGETLSFIAQELQRQVPDLSIYAIMQALFEENPDAFINNNINGLIKGSILDIRDLDQIRSADLLEARRFFQQQVADWDPSSLANNSSESGIGVGQDNYTSDSDLFGSDAGSNTDSSSGGDSFQIGASTDTDTFVSSGQGDSSDGEVLRLSQQLTELKSSLASSEQENEELTQRLLLLEGQLKDINRLMGLNVENTDFAVIESALAEQNKTGLDGVAEDLAGIDTSGVETEASDVLDEFLNESTDASSGDDLSLEPQDEAATTTDDLLNEFLTDDSVDGGIDEASDTGNLSLDDDASLGSEPQSVIEEVIEETPKPVTPVVNTPVKSESMLDKVGGLVPILGGLGALLVAGLGLFVWRRRRADEEFEISMLSIESNSQSVDVDTESGMSASISASVTASAMEGVDDVDAHTADKETSFLTVYSDSDAVVQADEVDPIAEADVYIAYGRDEQAEEVLIDGIASHPDRVDVKSKLIGLYYKNKNVEGFERIAEELYAQRESMAGNEWQEISDMGKELVPENPLFSLSGMDFDAVEQASESVDTAPESTEDEAAASDDDVLVFDSVDETSESDLAELVSEDKAADAPVEDLSEMIVESLNDDASIQLINFDDGRSEISELDEVEIDALAVEEGDDGVLEFNTPAASSSKEQDLLDLDVNATAEDLSDGAVDSDDLVFDFDAPAADLSSDSDESDTDDFGEERAFSEVPEVSDLVIDPEYDEAQTQYELAKVFVDLGDDDGARKILQDLVANKDNSDELIANSQELLDSMNG